MTKLFAMLFVVLSMLFGSLAFTSSASACDVKMPCKSDHYKHTSHFDRVPLFGTKKASAATVVVKPALKVVGKVETSASLYHLQKNPAYFGSRLQVYKGESPFASQDAAAKKRLCDLTHNSLCNLGVKFVQGPCSQGFVMSSRGKYFAMCYTSFNAATGTVTYPGGSVKLP